MAAAQPQRAARRGLDPAHDDVYDQQLAIAVQNFQREHRLNVDGIAGLQTQVVLDTALGRAGLALADARSRRTARTFRMSFILDALKKSEIERQRQSHSRIDGFGYRTRRPRFPLWAIALAVLLAVNLACCSSC